MCNIELYTWNPIDEYNKCTSYFSNNTMVLLLVEYYYIIIGTL